MDSSLVASRERMMINELPFLKPEVESSDDTPAPEDLEARAGTYTAEQKAADAAEEQRIKGAV